MEEAPRLPWLQVMGCPRRFARRRVAHRPLNPFRSHARPPSRPSLPLPSHAAFTFWRTVARIKVSATGRAAQDDGAGAIYDADRRDSPLAAVAMEASSVPSPLASAAASAAWGGDRGGAGGGSIPHAQAGAAARSGEHGVESLATEDGLEADSVVYGQGVPLDDAADVAVGTGSSSLTLLRR